MNNKDDFDALRIIVASTDQVLSWSHGEVKKPETINYRTHRAEIDGLMDERIFGPTKNYECYCGKYKKIRYKGIVCDQCGVEVTNKRVRRERMGHIKLASPVTHVWYAYGIPNKLSLILDTPQKKLETVIYFARYIVTEYSEEGKTQALERIEIKNEEAIENMKEEAKEELKELKNEFKEQKNLLKKEEKDENKLKHKIENLESKENKEIAKLKSLHKQKETQFKERFKRLKDTVSNLSDGTTLSEDEYTELREFDIDFFHLGMGAEAIKKLLSKVDLEQEIEKVENDMKKTRSVLKKRKYIQRLRMLKGMKQAGIDPAWMVLEAVPVLPPDLRPIIQLPGGRFATSDLNDLYRRVINRNNRLKRLIKLGAPEIILRNEKRMLQEAVDALIDNSHRPGNPVLNSRDQAYKSLSDMLRGKQGRFRQNLLGKRVDYSARSVIVPGPELNAYQVGIPKTIALELFKPYVISEILKDGYAPNIKSAKLYYEGRSDEVWDILEKVTKKHPVLLNRAPTLHKQGIQAFFPVLVEGNAIQIHPMVCKGFNADFDGDQMAIHVPLTRKAVNETIARMFVDSNILLMADGSPVVGVAKDMALGIYYLTQMEEPKDGKTKYGFGNVITALGFFDMGRIDLHEPITVLYKGKKVVTSPGRLIFNEILPKDYDILNEQINKKKIGKILADILDKFGSEMTVDILDKIKDIGFRYASQSGISVSFEDFVISDKKNKILEEVAEKENQYTEDYYMGLLTADEKKRLVEELWIDTIDKVADLTWKKYQEENNVLVTLNDSGAIPVENPVRQISGVKGLVLDPEGNIVELPLRSNYKEGLTSLEYFVAARGTRKGLADTALKTSGSGYLTRRLVDVAQDVITREDDCETEEGIYLEREKNRRMSFGERLHGRVVLEDIVDPKTGEILVKKQELITEKVSEQIEKIEDIKKIYVRSPLTCKLTRGVCTKCYGRNLGTGKLVSKGIAVGTIAAQSMGEAATQLTLNTKHLAGRVGTDITQGLPRVEELFEARVPKAKATLSEINGKIKKIIPDEKSHKYEFIIDNKDYEKTDKKDDTIFKIQDGDKPQVKRSKKVKAGDIIIERKDGKKVEAPANGRAKLNNKEIIFSEDSKADTDKTFTITVSLDSIVLVKEGDDVIKGQKLTEGSIDPKELMQYVDMLSAQTYIIDNIQETYGIQGISIDDKHVETVVRQMSRFVKIMNSGDGDYLEGDLVDFMEVEKVNAKLLEEGKTLMKVKQQMLGITSAAIKTESFLSAASFQEQVRVLTDAALIGKIDDLRGLKENVIIGKPVPLGTELE